MAQTSIEMRDITHSEAHNSGNNDSHDSDHDTDHHAANVEFSLPPVDGGKQAWLFLAACWGVEAVTFGFGFSFGVFQEYYSDHEPFANSSGIAAIGTSTTGIMYIGTPFVLAVCRLYPRQARWFTLLGLFVASLSLAMSSFCTKVSQLIVTQGILYGVGGCIAYCPCTLYIDEWFARRKGMAYGIVWSAAGLGGAILPVVIQTLLNRFGRETALQICAGILFTCSCPLAFFVKPRLPYAATTRRRPLNMRFVVSKMFGMYQFANIVQATGYFLPAIYLPKYASTVFDASTFLSALTVMLLNIAVTLGLVGMGLLVDKLPVTTCMIISAIGAAISALLIWGFAESLAVLYIFSIIYGLSAGSWSSIWPGIMRDISQSGESEGYGHVDPVMVQGHLCVGRGLGNIVSGPLSGLLVKGLPWQGKLLGGYGSGYGILILYTGLTGLVSGLNFMCKRFKLL